MRVNLKTLGLALVAAFAMSAVAVSSASAQEVKFTAEAGAYPAVMTGHEEGAKLTENYFEATDERRTTCQTVTYESTLEKASTSLTVTPHYDNCQAHSPPNFETTNNAEVHLNGCHYEFHALNEHSGPGDNETSVPATADIVCPDGKQIEITIAGGICEVHIHPQKGLTGVTFTNEPADPPNGTPDPWVTIDVDITNQIQYEETDNFLCPFEKDNHTTEDGDFVSTVVAKGFKDVGNIPHPTTSGDGVNAYEHGESIGIDVKTTTE